MSLRKTIRRTWPSGALLPLVVVVGVRQEKKTITLIADGSDVDDASSSFVLVDSLVVVAAAAADRINSLHLLPRPDETGQIRSTSECGGS